MDEAWKEFMVSGRVTDYLRYKGVQEGQLEQTQRFMLREERPDGTEYRGDWDGLKCHADWRL